ncbi:MAG TPA: UDP-N-acetylmuramoyl-tripeptide--D-alanyl-D-alanine ligase, partial [Chthoniobacterales bacterium]
MDPLLLTEIAQMSGGRLENGETGLTAAHLSKDTRSLRPGDLYLALRGENFDGNQFIEAARRAGAAGALVDDASLVERFPNFPLIVASDSLIALQRRAAGWRERLDLRVVGLSGSSGKTSTKDFTAAVLRERFLVTTTAGNLNNHIGLPLSILAAASRDQFAVWEMGMNHPGEIEPLARLARPDIAILTGIGVAHIENLGSREAIAAEKGALVRLTSPHGTVILPAEDDFTESLARFAPCEVVTVGLRAGQIRAEDIAFDSGSSRFTLLHGS